MKFKWWNKIIRNLFLIQLIVFIPLAILVWLLIIAAFNMVMSKETFNILSAINGGNMMVNIGFAFVAILIGLLFDWFAAIFVYLKFWKSSFRQHFDTTDVSTSFLTIDDRQILDNTPKWKTKNADIYDVGSKQPKNVMESFNKSLQFESNKDNPGFLVRNVWDAKTKQLNAVIANDVNAAVNGDTGSGKTASIIMPTIIYNAKLENKPSMVINDPKGELYHKTAKELKNNGYEIKVFNLFDTTKSHSWNPLTSIFDNWQKYLNTQQEIRKVKVGDVNEAKAMIQAHCWTSHCYTHFMLGCSECIEKLVEEQYINQSINWGIGFVQIEDTTKNEATEVYFATDEEMNKWLHQRQRIHKGETFGQISELAAILYTIPDPKSEFFYSAAREFFEGTLQFLLAISTQFPEVVNRSNFNLKSVRKIIANKNKFFEKISNHTSDLEKAAEIIKQLFEVEEDKISNKVINKAKELEDFIELNSLIENDWQTKLADTAQTFYKDPANVENWWKTMTNALQVFDNIELESIICETTIQAKELITKPTVVFLIIPDTKTAYNGLVSLFVGQMYSQLISEASKRSDLRLERKILFILDEFGLMKRVEPLINAFAICRSRNINMLICFQMQSQLLETYGKNNSSSILGNCQLTYFISSQERSDYEKYSKDFGMTTELKRTFSSNDKDTKESTSESLEKVPLLPIEELEQLKKPLVAILLNDKKYISYLLPTWIGENNFIDYLGNKVYDHSPLTVQEQFKNNFLYNEGYDIKLYDPLTKKAKELEKENAATDAVTEMMTDENSNVVRQEILTNSLTDERLENLMNQLIELKKTGEMTPEIRQKIVELNKIILRKRVNMNNN
ncbi:type IV secretory system conjugative DNA transfer family protein [Williamsoniiplasma lucivorax]|uniref:Conjugation protein n=1 Tax=Williamsoniiplasma lucivorax TaxID=209274 RepID=A0A2S5RF98_9MOLU|nr:type IV secretory system conjugative DNA transfer family protein [Williamsoniiplasma lucivorax]PPE05967.1 conjugation protein [Williamsoniiplasma lucivorax]